jgi:hypothetical protein
MDTRKIGEARYSAHIGVSNDGEVIDMVIRRAIKAGIDGPFGGLETVDDLDTAERYLRQLGYTIGPWKFVKAYDGLRLEAVLTDPTRN